MSLIDICYSESEPGVFGPILASALSPKFSCKFWLLATKKAAAGGSNFETSIRLTVEAEAYKDFTPILECSHNLPGATLFWIEGPAAPTG